MIAVAPQVKGEKRYEKDEADNFCGAYMVLPFLHHPHSHSGTTSTRITLFPLFFLKKDTRKMKQIISAALICVCVCSADLIFLVSFF